MTRTINIETIFDGTNAKVINTISAETVKIQGVGSGTYTLKGRLTSDSRFDPICAIKASDFSKKSEIIDDSVWSADIAGYAQITVEASGFSKIYAVLIG